MNTTATTSSRAPAAMARGRPLLPVATVAAVAATLANAALWAGGRASGVDFLATPAGVDSAMEVGLALVIVATLASFAAGTAVLALAARRSRRWVRIVTMAAAGFTAVSVAGPLTMAQDTATGVLLAVMHLLTGAAFVVTALTAGQSPVRPGSLR